MNLQIIEEPPASALVELDCGCLAFTCDKSRPLIGKLNGLIVTAARGCRTTHFADDLDAIMAMNSLRQLLVAAHQCEKLRAILREVLQ